MQASDDVVSMADGEWITTLGRHFLLGSLYDYRNDNICESTLSLWSDQTPVTSKQFASQFEVIAEDSLSSIARRLDIKESQRLSLFGGLIDTFSGSAKYLYDYRFSKQRVQVALRYFCTTHKNQLNLDALPDSGSSLDVPATHVATGILYGAEAIFVFHKEVTYPDDYDTVYRHLQDKVVKLCDALNTASNIDEQYFIGDQLLSFTYYGDFQFQANALNIENAVKLCKSVPAMLVPSRENNPSLVPKLVCLRPLNEKFGCTPKLVKEISADWVIQIEMFVQEVYDIEMRCRILLTKEVSQYFSVIKHQLSHFKNMIFRHRKCFLQPLVQLLPKIRDGEEEETQLDKLFENYHRSPFNAKHLHSWLEEKECEISLLAYCLEELSKVPGKHLQKQ